MLTPVLSPITRVCDTARIARGSRDGGLRDASLGTTAVNPIVALSRSSTNMSCGRSCPPSGDQAIRCRCRVDCWYSSCYTSWARREFHDSRHARTRRQDATGDRQLLRVSRGLRADHHLLPRTRRQARGSRTHQADAGLCRDVPDLRGLHAAAVAVPRRHLRDLCRYLRSGR
jgi:hypothetical protein